MNKILWFFWGNAQTVASSRIHGMAVHNQLVKLGYHSFFAYSPLYTEDEIPFTFTNQKIFLEWLCPSDWVVLQKIKSPANLPLIINLKKRGVQILLIDCDLPVASEIGRVANRIVCTSVALCQHYKKIGLHAHFIEDSPEKYYENLQRKAKEKLECYWFGDNSPQKWKEVQQLEQIIQQVSDHWKLITISNHPNASYPWTPNFIELLKEADAVALPVFLDDESSMVKSANRLLQSMALSVPVICSRLPAYENILTDGKDGLICESDEQWVKALRLLNDTKQRSAIGRQAYETAKNFSLDKSINKWIDVMELTDDYRERISKTEQLKIQRTIHQYFYRELARRNLFYFKQLSFTPYHLGWFFYCTWLKIWKRIISVYRIFN